MPRYSRHVGQALKFLDPGAQPPVPWHRVIGASGTISSRGPGTDGANIQRLALEAEGVEVTVTRGGEFRVDMRRWGWFPAPAAAQADSNQSGETEDEGHAETSAAVPAEVEEQRGNVAESDEQAFITASVRRV